MTARHDLERRVADFYATEAPHRAPDRVLEQAFATIDTTRQRRELGLVPWRYPTMNLYAKLAVAAVVAIAVGAIGLTLLGPRPSASVGGPGPTSSSAPTASPPESSSQLPSPPPLTGSYTSAVHGLSISYPAGWTTVPASKEGPVSALNFGSREGDVLHDPELRDHLFIALGSEPLDGQEGEAWATAELEASGGCTSGPRTITIDGAPGLMCDSVALTWAGSQGYVIWLHVSPDDPKDRQIYDEEWFEDVLASVRLPQAN